MRFSPLFLLLALALGLSACDSTGIDTPSDRPTPDGPGDHDGNDDGGDDDGGDDDGGDDDGGDDDGGDDSDDGYEGPTFLDLSPSATYLRTSDDPDALDAEPIALSDLGLASGDVACFKTSGDFWLYENDLRASENDQPLMTAIFSGDDALDGRAKLHRVTGALGAGDDVQTPETYLNARSTDIDEDFDATDACVTVPDGAEYLFLSAYDVHFSDNTVVDPDDDPFGVTIERH